MTYKSRPIFCETHVVRLSDDVFESHDLARITIYEDEDGYLCLCDVYTGVTDEPDSYRDPFSNWKGEHLFHGERCKRPWGFSDMHAIICDLCGADNWDSLEFTGLRPDQFADDGGEMVRVA